MGGPTEWESRWQDCIYIHTHIHTYIHIGTISARTGEVEKDSNSSYISHQHISLMCSASRMQQIDSFR